MSRAGRNFRRIIVRDFITGPADVDFMVVPVAGYVEEVRYSYATAGAASSTARLRKITDTSAPGAAASGTVIELTNTMAMDAAANTARLATFSATAAQRRVKAGDRLAIDFAGTVTALAGLVITLVIRADSYAA